MSSHRGRASTGRLDVRTTKKFNATVDTSRELRDHLESIPAKVPSHIVPPYKRMSVNERTNPFFSPTPPLRPVSSSANRQVDLSSRLDTSLVRLQEQYFPGTSADNVEKIRLTATKLPVGGRWTPLETAFPSNLQDPFPSEWSPVASSRIRSHTPFESPPSTSPGPSPVARAGGGSGVPRETPTSPVARSAIRDCSASPPARPAPRSPTLKAAPLDIPGESSDDDARGGRLTSPNSQFLVPPPRQTHSSPVRRRTSRPTHPALRPGSQQSCPDPTSSAPFKAHVVPLAAYRSASPVLSPSSTRLVVKTAFSPDITTGLRGWDPSASLGPPAMRPGAGAGGSGLGSAGTAASSVGMFGGTTSKTQFGDTARLQRRLSRCSVTQLNTPLSATELHTIRPSTASLLGTNVDGQVRHYDPRILMSDLPSTLVQTRGRGARRVTHCLESKASKAKKKTTGKLDKSRKQSSGKLPVGLERKPSAGPKGTVASTSRAADIPVHIFLRRQARWGRLAGEQKYARRDPALEVQ